MPLPRNIEVDAFFQDEFPIVPFLVSNPRGVHFNRFTDAGLAPMTMRTSMQNPLDPLLASVMTHAESQIPVALRGRSEWFAIYIPPALYTIALVSTPAFPVKITLLFAVGAEYNRHGLRSYFATSTDRILITIPGIESSAATLNASWGIGITTDMILQLMSDAGVSLLAKADWSVDIVGGFSTGYRGLNGTVINSLVSLSSVKRVVIYDALYWGDEPSWPGSASLPVPAGVAPSPPGSGQNTWRMLDAIRGANPAVEIITYEVTEPGGTPRVGGLLKADVPVAGLINLKPNTSDLQSLILARVLDTGIVDGYFPSSSVPSSILALIPLLPPRGTLASSSLTAMRAASGTLQDWATNYATELASVTSADRTAGVTLIGAKLNQLMGWEVPNVFEMLHDGFDQEFGWEFLVD